MTRYLLTRSSWRPLSWADVRAGYVDALRTDRPRVSAGVSLGAVDYASGFAVGAVVARRRARR